MFDRFINNPLRHLRERSFRFVARQAVRVGKLAGLNAGEIEAQFRILGADDFADFAHDESPSIYDTSDRVAYYRNLAPNQIPDIDFFEPVGHIKDDFGYVVSYDFYDAEGNISGRRTSALYDNEALTHEQVLSMARERLEEVSPLLRGQRIDNIQIETGLRLQVL